MKIAPLTVVVIVCLLACAGEEKPPPPYNVSAESVGGGVELRWQSDGGDRFLIQRSEGTEFNFVDYAWTAGSQRFFDDFGVIPTQWYYYRVAAFHEKWEGQEDVFSRYSHEVGAEVK
jgi:hypothetical protein